METPQQKVAMLLFCLLALALAATVQARSQLLPGSCSFESDTCGYTSDGEITSWALHHDGRFVAVDAVDKQDGETEDLQPQKEITGLLLSPTLDYGDWSCLRLVYQISGSGSLEVLQRTEGESFDRPLWGSQAPSDSWVISSMDLQNSTEPYQIVVEGKPGRSAGSSVAIFEIHITPGYCLDCDFEESHLCGYSNQWNANVNWFVGGGGTQLFRNDIPDDHTYNNKTGHLMYVDSVYAKTFKEVAKLVSPMTLVPMSGCLSFQYQRSEDRGNLFSVYTRDRLGQYQELWRAGAENQSDWTETPGQWTPVQVDLKAPYSVQVVFEVAFNSPSGGRVAVDDVFFSPQFCSTDSEPTFDPSIANCDFESGFCQYSQDPTGSQWRRVTVQPNLFRIGDHTTGAGSFLLAQSQLKPHSDHTHRLVSPALPADAKFCLRFYFSLKGFKQMENALTVHLQHSGGHEKIWSQGEKSRGIWMATEVTFQTSKPSQVVFVSSCNSVWDCGSVALDDISLSQGDCELTEASLASSLPGHCDFESGLCGFSQDKRSDAADWERRRGPTPTSYTGPTGDHTTGLGYYLHLEASTLLPGRNVRLLSRPLRASRGPQCLHFYYNMYGSGSGHLRVLLSRVGGEQVLWQRSGEQSIAWLRGSVEYQCDSQHQIVFEAIRGSSVRSDTAIDDIILEGGHCPDLETRTIVETSNDIQ